jgi:valyl-tRNA synthetase
MYFGEATRRDLSLRMGRFCSWYIEDGQSTADSLATQATLVHVLSALCAVVTPYIPFVTEDIWSRIPGAVGSIMRAPWPQDDGRRFAEGAQIEALFEIIRRIRQVRNEYSVPYTKAIDVLIRPDSDLTKTFFLANRQYLDKFVNPKSLTV